MKEFFYDAEGRPYYFTYNGTVYYYVLNLMGDVIGLLDSNGSLCGSYLYDAWGNIKVCSGVGADRNPLRYRGYYYDSESGLYYLQSRYYDPQLGRFISADAFVATGQGLLGNNMFAYCYNAPVNYFDYTGNLPIRNLMLQANDGGGTYSTNGNPRLKTTAHQFEKGSSNIFNTSEEVVLNAETISFYKGVPVIKLPIGVNAFSFGAIFLGEDVGNRIDAIDTVKHEYGHSVHFSQIGPNTYTAMVMIPSMIGFWSGVPNDIYYSQPYEYIADYLGGVNRNNGEYKYMPFSESISVIYWGITMIWSGIMP